MTSFYQEGGCHCGALRYAVSKPPLATYVCHCTDCQRISGSAFNISIVFPSDSVSINGNFQADRSNLRQRRCWVSLDLPRVWRVDRR